MQGCELTEISDERVSALDGSADVDPGTFESMTLVPIMTSFVASLDRGAAFRVSIHHWDKPKPSLLLLSCKTPEEAIMFESRVYNDGILTA